MEISLMLSWLALGISLIILIIGTLSGWLWARRKIVAEAALASAAVGLLFLLVSVVRKDNSLLQGMGVVCISLIMLLALRLIKGRLPDVFLRQSTRKNAAALLCVALISYLGALFLPSVSFGVMITPFLLILLVVVGALTAQALWGRHHFTYTQHDEYTPLKDLPTVTLAIPARNETHALTDCLNAALKSDYPKLEIIVLDDCSYDQTPHLVRSFAHDGVRFIQGGAPAKHWVGKTFAYDRLLQEALGEYILFIGADTLLEPTAVSKLVQYTRHYKLDMLSILPTYAAPRWWAQVVQPLRYAWQMARPFSKNYAPVSSECWLIRRAAVRALGGFSGVKQQLVPEATFAKRLLQNGRYRFLVANKELQVSYTKKWSSLAETSLRLLYPQSHRQPVVAIMRAVSLVAVIFLPVTMLFVAMPVFLYASSLLMLGLLYGTYAVLLARMQNHLWFLAVLLLPIVLLQEAVLIVISMLKYEFGEVNWKDRNICYPVLHGPTLPPKS